MNIEEALKQNQGMRIDYNEKWLVWGDTGTWEVWTHKYHARNSTLVNWSNTFEIALRYLVEE